MAVVDVKEIWDDRQGSEDDKAERNYTRSFRVITNSMLTSSLSVRYATGIPDRFDPYQDADGTKDSTAFAQTIKEHQTDDPFTWIVVVEYSTKLEQPDLGGENPLKRPSEIKWGTTKFTKPAEMTVDDPPQAIVNSAGSQFDPPPEIEECRLTLNIQRNELGFDPSVLGAFVDTVNGMPFMGFPQGEVKCVGIGAERVYEKGIFYWKVSYDFEIKAGEGAQAWWVKILDQGYMVVDPITLLAVNATDLIGRPVNSPILLDGFGAKLTQGADPVFLPFQIYDETAFGLLRLP